MKPSRNQQRDSMRSVKKKLYAGSWEAKKSPASRHDDAHAVQQQWGSLGRLRGQECTEGNNPFTL